MEQIKLFEYDQIDVANRDFVQDRTIEIKALVKRSAQDIIEIGLKLIEVKDRLPHGMWGKWLDVEFGWKTTTAWNFMMVATKFSNFEDLDSFGQSALYLLASPSTPDEAREEAINRASNGEVITHKAAKEIVNSYKEDEPSEDEPELIYGGGYAYCKYCYETHNQWELSADHSPTSWECQRCAHFTADQFMDLREKPIFTCPECDQTFNSEVWHCFFCNHHWQLSQRDCPNCHKDKLNEKEVSNAKRLRRDAPKIFEQVKSGEMSIVDAKKKVFETDSSKLAQPMQVLLSHKELEYYTPLTYIESARLVLDTIDLDPASSPVANETVKAGSIFTQDDNGLNKEWFGSVWLNPPYSKTKGKSNQELWANKLVNEYQSGNVKSGILLVKAALGYKWFEALFERWPVCLASERLSFIKTDGSSDGQSKHGTAFFYFGDNLEKFVKVFSRWGCIIDQRGGHVYPRKRQ